MTTTPGLTERKMNQGPKRGSRLPLRGGISAAPHGRTRNAYEVQPTSLKWQCWRCSAERATDIREGTKPPNELASFVSKDQLESHMVARHRGQMSLEQPTAGRVKRANKARFAAAQAKLVAAARAAAK